MSFSENYRANVTVAAAASALLESEHRCGGHDLLSQFENAVLNLQSDAIQISAVFPHLFSHAYLEEDALQDLIQEADGILRCQQSLMPDEAFAQAVHNHQKPHYTSRESVIERARAFQQARLVAYAALQRWEHS